MFYTFKDAVSEFWKGWCSLFDFLPYGDTYIAGAVLFLVVIVTCKLVADDRI